MIDGFSIRAGLLLSFAAIVAAADGGCAEPSFAAEGAKRGNGPCVLLKNDNVLFGRARQRGEFVVVEKHDGSEIQLARKAVACWAESLDGLYQYRVEHRVVHDAAALLKDARWCLKYGLYELAEKELRFVNRIEPGNRIAGSLSRQIVHRRQAASAERPDPTQPVIDAPSIRLASHQELNRDEKTFDESALQRFASHVQPLLLNRCGRCHAHDSKRSWKLLAPAFGSRPSARITQENLLATRKYVTVDVPLRSEIRSRAVDGHAGAATGPRAEVLLRTLDWWLRNEAASARRADERSDFEPASTPAADGVVQAAHVEPAAKSEESGPETASGIQRLPAVRNPFDPEIFNRRFHGDQ